MIRLGRHPSWRELNQLADGELDAASRECTTEHVATCSKCWRQVSVLHELGKAGREMRHPAPPRDLLEDVLRARADGARVILPVASPSPTRARRMLPAAAAIAFMVGLAGLATLTLTSEAGAGASELTVDPATPLPGERVMMTYRPGTELTGEEALRLRLNLRRFDAEPPRGTLGEPQEVLLQPDGEGRFVASFQLPVDFAFASMAVENLAGDRLDDRGGRLWELLAHATDSEPLPEALRQEFLVLQSRSWPDAREALHQLTLLYPEYPEGWSLLLTYEETARLPEEAAALHAVHREIYRRFQEQLVPDEMPIVEVAAMARYAGALGERAAHDRWLARLEALDPAHRMVVAYRVAGFGTDDAGAAGYLEGLWSEGWRVPSVAREGYWSARASGDASAERLWALRGLPLEGDHGVAQLMALSLVAHPDTRERGLAAVRDLLAHVEQEAWAERPLNATPEEARRDSRQLQARLRVGLATALLVSGAPGEALKEFDRAEDVGVWLTDLYRGRLEAKLAMGDSAGAMADFHRLAVDPIYSRASVDSLRYRMPAMPAAELRRGQGAAEAELRTRILSDQDLHRALPSTELRTSTGQLRSLGSLVAGRPTVLLVWDRRVFGSEEDVSAVIQARNAIADGSGQLLWITPEPDSESLQAFKRSAGLNLPAYQDPGSELAAALGEWGSRGYFVIDRAGVIRARTHSLMEAVRHLEVLQMGSRDTA